MRTARLVWTLVCVAIAGVLACGRGGDGGDAAPDPFCGDGTVDPGELCDDGNGEDGDGCASDCLSAHCLVPITHGSIAEGLADAACDPLFVASGNYPDVGFTRNVTLIGVGAEPVTIDGDGSATAVLNPGHVLRLEGVQVTGGVGTVVDEWGGGIHNDGELTLVDCEVFGNSAKRGGGIGGVGAVTLRNTVVRDNVATVHGGGLDVEGLLRVEAASRVTGNRVDARGSELRLQGAGIRGLEVRVSGGSVIADNELMLLCVGAACSGSGGGVFAESLSVTENSRVEDNRITISGDASVFETVAARGGGVAIAFEGQGLHVEDSEISGNRASAAGNDGAQAEGAAIYLYQAQGTITRSLISGNRALVSSNSAAPPGNARGFYARGGAVYAAVGTGQLVRFELEVRDSWLSDNQASASGVQSTALGGAMFLEAGTGDTRLTTTVVGSTLSGNQALDEEEAGFVFSRGGAISADAGTGEATIFLYLTNSTLSGNAAHGGGGIWAAAGTGASRVDLLMFSSTLTDNLAQGSGGGVFFQKGISASAMSVRMGNNILQGNSAPMGPDCASDLDALRSDGYNLIGDASLCARTTSGDLDLIGGDPALGALTDNGGPTPTHALGSGSAAINAANPAGCRDHLGLPLQTDQRGEPRSNRCDIGAFEVE